MMHLVTSPIAPPPIAVGDAVRIEAAVYLPSGRRIRRGSYDVVEVLPGRAVVIDARPDCSTIGKTFDKPGSPARDRQRFVIEPGQYTAYADGEPAPIPDHHVQTA